MQSRVRKKDDLERRANLFIRAFLSLVLVISLMPVVPHSAFADEIDASIASEAVDPQNSLVEDSSEPSDQDAPIASQAVEAPESKPLGFVYFGEASPVAGSIQKIAVAVDDDALTVSSAKLVYEDPQGKSIEIEAEKYASSAALFSIQTEGAGVYRLVKMEATAKTSTGEAKQIEVDLSAQDGNCQFEVQADTGVTLSTQAGEADEDCMSVYALNAQGEVEEADDLDGALALAGSTALSSRASRAGKFVVALDPGHGGTDPGAVSGGLNEADINWKIAQACKTELEKYGNVEVYVTRAQNETLSSLSARVDRAVEHGAQVFVSIHINSASAASAKGAEVWYPNDSSYKKAETHDVAKDLSQKILDELGALGLSKRGIKMKDSQNNSKYPDGSVRDYYGVIASSREHGIPGIIVEHAFITNTDENKKLADDSFLVQLGQADARGIAQAFGLSKSAGGWEQQADGSWKYKNADGSYAANTWVTVSNKRYWIDANGIMVTGVQTINGTTYSFDASGALQTPTGWQQIEGAWYYFAQSGVAQTGWAKIKGKWYYLDPADGKMVTGWITVDGKRYFLNDSGAMRTSGWFNQDGNWYWITSSGAAQTGWQKVKDKWYYLDPATTIMQTGWITVDGKRYFLNDSGAMRTSGWFQQDGNWYWITSSGAAQAGWVKVKGKWYYLDPATNIMQTGWVTVDGKRYFLNDSGAMRTSGWFKQDGNWYWITSSGAMATGWVTVGGKQYYLDENGKMLTGQQTIDGERCFFESSGAFVGHGTPIMGVSQVNAARMTQAYLASGKVYPSALAAGGAPDPAAFCKIIEEEANAEGVRAEVLWSQIMWETGWLQMGNDVKLSQYNFGGLGATGGGAAGASFPDVRTGIRAQAQHLKCYASTDPLNGTNVDPRWSTSLRGKAKLVEWLGIPENPNGTGWAASKEYGYNLVKLMENNLGIK